MTKELIVPGINNLVINDTRIPDQQVREIFAAYQPQADVLSAQDMTVDLIELLAIAMLEAKDPRNITVLFPGNGARAMQQFLPSSVLNQIPSENQYFLPTNRIFEENKPIYVELDLPEKILNNDPNGNIWICDDVVASGLTVRTIYEEIAKAIKFPTQWRIFSWLQRQDAELGPVQSLPAFIYKPRSGKRRIPLNSLSTLLSNDIKALQVQERFAKKYFQESKVFDKLIQSIKENI